MQQVVVNLVDDLDGKAASQTVTFGLDGVAYEVDLSDKNAAKLREALGPWVAVARRVGKAPARRKQTAGRPGPAPRAVREWARANGFDVPARGRIPAAVLTAFEEKAPNA